MDGREEVAFVYVNYMKGKYEVTFWIMCQYYGRIIQVVYLEIDMEPNILEYNKKCIVLPPIVKILSHKTTSALWNVIYQEMHLLAL